MHNEAKRCLPVWESLYRLIPSHFPPVDLFEDVSDPDDLEIIFMLESRTNDRLRDEVGLLSLVPQNDRICGVGSTPVMAAFTHIGVESRFTNGVDYGVYYGAKDVMTAIKETVHHREKFLRKTNEPDTELTMRCYANKVALEMHDIRPDEFAYLHTEDYTVSQPYAANMRKNGSNGLVYRSVRNPGGECVAAFKPKAVTIPIQAGHYTYHWSAHKDKITSVMKVENVPI